jgi:EAL and modified HD-GYP domain-containing signal transduction protein
VVKIFIARQPIIDQDGRIFAYELLFRSGFTDRADVEEGRTATVKVIESLISSFGLRPILRDKKGFINIDETMDILSIVEVLPVERIGFEILESSVLSESFLENMTKLRELGYELSLDDFVFSEEIIPYLNLVDYVKIDVLEYDERTLEEALRTVRRFNVKTIAEKVETYEMFRLCRDLGFDYFQGFFFQKPQIVTSKTIEPAYAALIRLYNLISQEAEVKDIEKVFKKFSELSVKLLQLINSAYYSLRQPVRSIRHAILMLGYRNLLRWVLILMYSLRREDFTSDPLFEEASIRGFFMERLTRKVLPGEEMAEKAFIAGILSLVDVLLGVPKEEALRTMWLERDIKEAIISRSGPLGDMLNIVENVQRWNFRAIRDTLRNYRLSPPEVLEIQAQALRDYASLEF